jgi:hypothetical protein
MSDRRNRTDFERRQHATLPLDVIRNEALFEGLLIKGGRPLTPLQRIGTVIIGVFLLFVPVSAIVVIVQSRMKGEPMFDLIDGRLIPLILILGAASVFAGFAYCGVRMLKNAFTVLRKR